MPQPHRRDEENPRTDLGAGLLLLGGWHLVLGSHHKLVVCSLGWKTQKVKSCQRGHTQDCAHSPSSVPPVRTPQPAQRPAAGCSLLLSSTERGAGARARSRAGTDWVHWGQSLLRAAQHHSLTG